MTDLLFAPESGAVCVFFGDGRGKTSAALGQVMLAVEAGLSCHIIFFMKATRRGGEYMSLTRLPRVTFESYGRPGFMGASDTTVEDIRLAREALEQASLILEKSNYNLVVLDEIINAVGYGLISVEDVLVLLSRRKPITTVILTGKSIDRKLDEIADVIIEFKKIKHPYDKGILARHGIDY